MLLLPAAYATAQSPHSGNVSGTAHLAVSSAKKSTSISGKSTVAHHRMHRTVRHRRHAKPEAAIVVPAPAPLPPVHPADQPAIPATVEFHQGILSVHAQNSSLVAILDQISRQTGLVIEGLSHDQRMYGQYGPGNISTTLSALLDGSGYNYVIVGGAAGHSPTQLVLSTATAGVTNAPALVSNEQPTPTAGEQSAPVDPTAPVSPKTPQEIFNELRRMHPQ
ncbi:MAG: hypothetical protein ACLQMO_11260 [Acidobacteriaceae bacterium]